MMNADAALGLSGFLEWSEPVIFDRLASTAYQAHLGLGRAAAETCAVARAHVAGADFGRHGQI